MKITACSLVILTLVLSACSRTSGNGTNISFIAGTVSVNGSPVRTGAILKNGSRIVTGKNSGCDVTLNEKSIIRIKENSDTVLYQNGANGSLDINSGTVMSFIKKIPGESGEKNAFTLKTPTMVAIIWGTTFFLKVENPDSTYLCACNGIIEVHDSYLNEKHILSSPHHKGIRIKRGVTKLFVTETGLQYHTDAEMESLAQKTGRTLDWTRIDTFAP